MEEEAATVWERRGRRSGLGVERLGFGRGGGGVCEGVLIDCTRFHLLQPEADPKLATSRNAYLKAA